MAGSSAGFELVLDIEGMTCASCVYRIEKVLRRQACVEEATVSLASRSAVVRSTVSDPQLLIEAVRRAGYGASLRDRQGDRPDEVADYQRRLLVSEWESLADLARRIGKRPFDLDDPRDRRAFRGLLLTHLRPTAIP